jgi:hypothetical protein
MIKTYLSVLYFFVLVGLTIYLFVKWVTDQTNFLITFAGTPATTVFGGTSLVTTAPAPTIAFSPIVTPHIIVAEEPIDAPFLT